MSRTSVLLSIAKSTRSAVCNSGGQLAGLAHRVLHQRDGVDDVEPLALDDLQRDRRFAVIARRAFAILEGQANVGQVAQGDHPVAIHLHRQVVDVARPVEGGRDLHRKGAGLGADVARRDQLVVVDHRVEQLARRDVVGFKPQRVDHHLDHLLAVAGERCFEDCGQRLDPVLQVLGGADQRALGQIARKRHDQDRELRKVDLVDRGLLIAHGELRLGLVDGVAHIGKRLGPIPAEFELQHQLGKALGAETGHPVEAVKALHLGLQRLDQHLFGIGGRNARKRHGDEQRRDLDVGLALFRQRGVGKHARDQRQQDERHHHPGTAGGPVDKAGHVPGSR
jgi:hypothetical protein